MTDPHLVIPREFLPHHSAQRSPGLRPERVRSRLVPHQRRERGRYPWIAGRRERQGERLRRGLPLNIGSRLQHPKEPRRLDLGVRPDPRNLGPGRRTRRNRPFRWPHCGQGIVRSGSRTWLPAVSDSARAACSVAPAGELRRLELLPRTSHHDREVEAEQRYQGKNCCCGKPRRHTPSCSESASQARLGSGLLVPTPPR